MKIQQLNGKIDSILLEKTGNIESIKLESITPPITHNRFDLSFKLLYLDSISRQDGSVFEKQAYKEHIKAFSLGKFKEIGNDKNTIEDYEKTFIDLYCDIKNNGFNDELSYIPLANDGSILNGAHRTAISIHLNKSATCVTTDIPPVDYDYSYFKNRGLPDIFLDEAAIKYVEKTENCFLAILWPSAEGHTSEAEALIDKIVYKKEITLNYLGAHNLLSEAYEGEPWLGPEEKDFPGIKNKLTKCFPNFRNIKVYVFQNNSLEETIILKEKIRSIYNIGKHSIHITDSQEEALRLSRLLLNANGIHFLNHAKPFRYTATIEKIRLFKKVMRDKDLSSNKYIIDSGLVLAVYGLRKASDIDYLTTDIEIDYPEIDHHEKELSFHLTTKDELIYNPNYYFYYKGIKFISLPQIFRMKGKRAEKKDIADNLLIKNLIENNSLNSFFRAIKYKIHFIKAKILSTIIVSGISITKKLGIYSYVRSIYKKQK